MHFLQLVVSFWAVQLTMFVGKRVYSEQGVKMVIFWMYLHFIWEAAYCIFYVSFLKTSFSPDTSLYINEKLRIFLGHSLT